MASVMPMATGPSPAASLQVCPTELLSQILENLALCNTEFPCPCGAETRELVQVQDLDPYAFLAERPTSFDSEFKAGGV